MFAYRISVSLATLLLGLMAGFFFAFSIDVAPAMVSLSASSYIGVRNGSTGWCAMWALAVSTLVRWSRLFVPDVLVLRASHRRLALAWVSVALVYFVEVFWLTRSINVPINDALAQWYLHAPPPNWAALRDRWNEANLWRTGASAACFVAAIALLALPSGNARGVPAP